jgi:hypothetical protein
MQALGVVVRRHCCQLARLTWLLLSVLRVPPPTLHPLPTRPHHARPPPLGPLLSTGGGVGGTHPRHRLGGPAESAVPGPSGCGGAGLGAVARGGADGGLKVG